MVMRGTLRLLLFGKKCAQENEADASPSGHVPPSPDVASLKKGLQALAQSGELAQILQQASRTPLSSARLVLRKQKRRREATPNQTQQKLGQQGGAPDSAVRLSLIQRKVAGTVTVKREPWGY
jgi:hypothetical protein